MVQKSIISQLEKDIALILLQKASNQEIDEKTTSNIAKHVLEILSPKSLDNNLEKILIKLKKIYSEFSPVLIKYFQLIHNEKDKDKINLIKQKINHILYKTNVRN